jgi:hypothetical protein
MRRPDAASWCHLNGGLRHERMPCTERDLDRGLGGLASAETAIRTVKKRPFSTNSHSNPSLTRLPPAALRPVGVCPNRTLKTLPPHCDCWFRMAVFSQLGLAV